MSGNHVVVSAMDTDPDPHGQAALMLCESVALILIERGLVGKEQMQEAISGVIEVKREMAGADESVVVSVKSISLLHAVARSISAAPDPLVKVAS